jgi:surface antigen
MGFTGRKRIIWFAIVPVVIVGAIFVIYFRYFSYNPVLKDTKWGMAVDSFNNVKVYFNGSISTINGRNRAPDGYNLGLKYQCVEFVKRYYYEYLHHKMPDSYGNAKDFFDPSVADGAYNSKRDLRQYSNPSASKPKVNDLVIMDGGDGHVAIVCNVSDDEVTIIQQNPGPMAPSRISYGLKQEHGKWRIDRSRLLGWLRKE